MDEEPSVCRMDKESEKDPKDKGSKVCLYWSGPRVSDIQDCDGLFDGAITLYGYEEDPKYGDFYGTLKQSLSEKTEEGLFDNPNFCNSSFNIKSGSFNEKKKGKCICPTRINHNLKSTLEDLFILLHELNVIIEKEKDGTVVRFMTYNPNYVSRYGNCDYIQLLVRLISDKDKYSTTDRGEFLEDENNCLPEYAEFGISKDDAQELFDRLIFDYDSNYEEGSVIRRRIEEDRALFKKVMDYLKEKASFEAPAYVMNKDREFIEKVQAFWKKTYNGSKKGSDGSTGKMSGIDFTDYSNEKYCTKKVFDAIEPAKSLGGEPATKDERTRERDIVTKLSKVDSLFKAAKKYTMGVSINWPLRRRIKKSKNPAELVKAIRGNDRLFKKLVDHLKGSLQYPYEGCIVEVMPQVVCNIILDHMLCMNQNEEIMHTLDHKDRFRRLCRKLEVGTTEGEPYVLPRSFVENGKNLLEYQGEIKCGKRCRDCPNREGCKPCNDYFVERDKLFADLKKNVSSSRIVVQEVQSSGGFGTYLIEKSEDLDTILRDLDDTASMRGDEEYQKRRYDYIVSRYRFPNVPVNIHAIITRCDIILLPPSIQNIVILNNKLIYSGADFYAYEKFAEQKENKVRDSEFKEYATWICRSLQNHGYRGVIGFDAIISDSGIEFVEANNRFQASTILINKALRDLRYLRSEEGFPVRRIDGMKIRQGEIVPSAQALNLMAFYDRYDTKQDKDNYEICMAVMREYDSKIDFKVDSGDDFFPRYSGLVNTKIPYSCIIYYEDERSFSEGLAKKHYCHMVKRAEEIKERYKEDRAYRVASVLRSVFERIVSLTADFDEFAMGNRRAIPRPGKGDPGSFKKIINDTIFRSDHRKDSTITELLGLVFDEHIRYCSRMEHDITEYYKDKQHKPSEEDRENFWNACESLRDIIDIRDYFIDTDNFLRKSLDSPKVKDKRKKVVNRKFIDSYLFFSAEFHRLLDDELTKNTETGERLMREIDRILSAEECTIDESVPCDIFDNDVKSDFTWQKVSDDDYCCPGSYAVKLIFSRNVLSVLNLSVQRDPNVMPPSTEWYKRIRDGEILPVKIGLINNGVNLSKDLDDIREGVNHSVDLRISTESFNYHGKDYDGLDINCECGTPTSAFSPFSVKNSQKYMRKYCLLYPRMVIPKEKMVIPKEKTEIFLCYYGKPLGITGSYESPIEKLKKERIPNSGIPLSSIAFVATDRVRFQHSDQCRYASIGRGCKFCEFTAKGESTSGNTQYRFGEQEILDGIEKTDEILRNPKSGVHVDHVLIGGGTMFGNPSDVKTRIIRMCDKIKETFGKNNEEMGIYLMCTPPVILSDMDDFRKAGVTEVSFNMEVYDHHLAGEYMPGKRSTSTSGYIAALRYATSVWRKKGSVRSALIVGLEDLDSTMEGIRALTSIGVAPILSIFRPTPGTELEWMKPFDSEVLYDFYLEADKVCEGMKMEFGPECLHCQNNTLVLPRALNGKKFN